MTRFTTLGIVMVIFYNLTTVFGQVEQQTCESTHLDFYKRCHATEYSLEQCTQCVGAVSKAIEKTNQEYPLACHSRAAIRCQMNAPLCFGDNQCFPDQRCIKNICRP